MSTIHKHFCSNGLANRACYPTGSSIQLVADGVGFEPTQPFGSHGFQDRGNRRSANHPYFGVESENLTHMGGVAIRSLDIRPSQHILEGLTGIEPAFATPITVTEFVAPLGYSPKFGADEGN